MNPGNDALIDASRKSISCPITEVDLEKQDAITR